MWQIFKPLTEQQYSPPALDQHQMIAFELEGELRKIDRMIEANEAMIEHLERELEMMK